MMRKLLWIWLVLTSLVDSLDICAQNSVEKYFLRNYAHSLCLEAKTTELTKTISSEIGDIELRDENIESIQYLFQGHEYDAQLGIIFLPSRVYSIKEYRFVQPDPKSQYVSPYNFVGGDPVNHIDPDANEGRPLVLFQEDHNYRGGMNPGTLDLQAVAPDAHFVPISDFINGKVGDLPEWNGNVFFRGHIGVNVKGRELISEAGSDLSKLKTEMGPGVHAPQFIPDYGTNVVTMDAEEMGRKLRRFSAERGVPIRNVTEGGCFGSYATEPMHKGFMEESKRFGKLKQKIKFRGSKEGYEARFTGDNVFRDLKFSHYPKETRFYLTPHGVKTKLPFRVRNFEKEFTGYTHSTNKGASYKPDFFIEGDEVRGMVDGSLSRKTKSLFSKISDVY